MKRFAVIILACVYFVACSGMLLRQHFCMGDLIETQIDLGQIAHISTCGDCGMEESESSCCESKVKLVKKVDDQQAGSYFLLSQPDMVAELPYLFSFCFVNAPECHLRQVTVALLPKPPPKDIPVFLEIRNLRI